MQVVEVFYLPLTGEFTAKRLVENMIAMYGIEVVAILMSLMVSLTEEARKRQEDGGTVCYLCNRRLTRFPAAVVFMLPVTHLDLEETTQVPTACLCDRCTKDGPARATERVLKSLGVAGELMTPSWVAPSSSDATVH